MGPIGPLGKGFKNLSVVPLVYEIYIADTAYVNEISPFWSDGTITEITVALGQFNVVGSVAITGSGSVEVIDATSHATLNLGDTVTLNA